MREECLIHIFTGITVMDLLQIFHQIIFALAMVITL